MAEDIYYTDDGEETFVTNLLATALDKLDAFDASELGRPDAQAELAAILDDLCREWKKLKAGE